MNINEWNNQKIWKTSNIESTAKQLLIIQSIISCFKFLFFNLIFYFIANTFLTHFLNYFPFVVLIIATLAFYKIILMFVEFNKFGNVVLSLKPLPPKLGSAIVGKINLLKINAEEVIHTPEKFEVILECVYSYLVPSGKNNSREEEIKWSNKKHPQISKLQNSLDSFNGSSLQFSFDLPEGLPSTQLNKKGNHYFWRIKIHGELKGINLSRSFLIPVINEGDDEEVETQPKKSINDNFVESDEIAFAINDFDFKNFKKILIAKEEEGSLELHFPMFRNKILSFFSFIFGLSFSSAFVSSMIINLSLVEFKIFPIIANLPFLGIGLFSLVAFFYLFFNQLKVTINKVEVISKRHIFSFLLKESKVSLKEIKNIEFQKSSSEGKGSTRVDYYKIFILNEKNQKMTIAETIPGIELARSLNYYIKSKYLK